MLSVAGSGTTKALFAMPVTPLFLMMIDEWLTSAKSMMLEYNVLEANAK